MLFIDGGNVTERSCAPWNAPDPVVVSESGKLIFQYIGYSPALFTKKAFRRIAFTFDGDLKVTLFKSLQVEKQ
jgi:hypothetical protein